MAICAGTVGTRAIKPSTLKIYERQSVVNSRVFHRIPDAGQQTSKMRLIHGPSVWLKIEETNTVATAIG
jgi:hypothetical protein